MHRYANRAGENEKQGPIRYVILDMAPISFIDATGASMLHRRPIYHHNMHMHCPCPGHLCKHACARSAQSTDMMHCTAMHGVLLPVCCSNVVALSAGMQTLFTLVGELRKEGKQLVLSNPSRELQKKLKRAKILDEIGQDWVFVRTSDAVAMCEQSLREEEAVSVSFPAPAAVNQE